jgi:hypothetical protein
MVEDFGGGKWSALGGMIKMYQSCRDTTWWEDVRGRIILKLISKTYISLGWLFRDAVIIITIWRRGIRHGGGGWVQLTYDKVQWQNPVNRETKFLVQQSEQFQWSDNQTLYRLVVSYANLYKCIQYRKAPGFSLTNTESPNSPRPNIHSI